MIQTANQMMWKKTNAIEPANRVMTSAIRFWMLAARASACLAKSGSSGMGSFGGTNPRCAGRTSVFDMAHRNCGQIVVLLPSAVNLLRGLAAFPGQPDGEFVGRDVMAGGAPDGAGGLRAAVLVGEPQLRRAGQVALPPLEHRPHDRHEIEPRVGEHVLVAAALARLLVGPAR